MAQSTEADVIERVAEHWFKANTRQPEMWDRFAKNEKDPWRFVARKIVRAVGVAIEPGDELGDLVLKAKEATEEESP